MFASAEAAFDLVAHGAEHTTEAAPPMCITSDAEAPCHEFH